jgi:hypothetical protein
VLGVKNHKLYIIPKIQEIAVPFWLEKPAGVYQKPLISISGRHSPASVGIGYENPILDMARHKNTFI